MKRFSYLEQPQGFEKTSETGEKLVYKLKKSIYGLKQSGRNWYKLLNDLLEENNFVRNVSDNCVYRREKQDKKVILIMWVDDLIVATSDEDLLNSVKRMLAERFRMKDLGRLNHFLGIDFNQTEGQVTMS